MSSTTSGRVRTRFSLQPSSDGSAEIGRGEVALLQHGAHGAIEHQDTLLQNVGERPLALRGMWS